MDVWLNLLQAFGLAALVLFFMGWCVIQLAVWIGPRLDRIIERSMKALDSTQETHRDIGERLLRLEERVESVWDFLLRRAAVEAVSRGVATMNSPVTFSTEARSWLAHLAPELRAFYNGEGQGLSENDLASAIERRWGARLAEEVCIPHDLSLGACLLLAIEVARDGDQADAKVQK